MKKIIIIFVLGFILLLSNITLAEIKVDMLYKMGDSQTPTIIVYCIDGYQFIYTVGNYKVVFIQVFEELYMKTVPKKCINIKGD